MNSLLLALTNTHIALISVGSAVLLIGALIFILVPMKTWFTAIFSGCYIRMSKLASLRMRKLKPMTVAKLYIRSKKAKLGLKFNDIESIYLAGLDYDNLLNAYTFAKSAKIPVNFEGVKSIYFAGYKPLEVFETAVKPKVVTLHEIKGICKDNYELILTAKVALQLNLQNFLGGVGEESVLATAQEQILTNIAACKNHRDIICKPELAAEQVNNLNFYRKSAYSVVSCEIIGVDIGRDMTIEMNAKTAEKELAFAQVEAERRKNDAIIETEQAKARVEELKAEVLEAEAEVPRAISEAIREGRFSVMDYYKLMNLQADTAMRRAVLEKQGDDE